MLFIFSVLQKASQDHGGSVSHFVKEMLDIYQKDDKISQKTITIPKSQIFLWKVLKMTE